MADHAESVTRYAILRGQIEHEDGLMTQRLSWLVASQSFLFTAYAIVLNAPEHAASAMHARQQAYVLTSIPTVAILSDALIYISVLAGVSAMRGLRTRWIAGGADSLLPPLQGTSLSRRLGLVPPLLMPLVFLVVWIFLFCHASGHASEVVTP